MSATFSLSPEVVMIDISSTKASLKPLLITFSLSKLSSNGSVISRSDILNVLAFKGVKKNTFINRTNEKKIIYRIFDLFNFF